jgi:hypothetical protein
MSKPGIWKRALAFVGNEIDAELLEAYRRAGSGIHDQLETASRKRLDLKLEGKNVWTSDRGSQLALLCTWNAHALQTLGDQMLDADYKANPATSGFVPRVTAEQAQGFYDQVEPWLSRARQASINPNYQIDVNLPATLPKWSEVEPCPRPHLDAMMAAVKHIQLHADAAFAGLELDNTPDDHRNTLSFLRQNTPKPAPKPSTCKTSGNQMPPWSCTNASKNKQKLLSSCTTTSGSAWRCRNSRHVNSNGARKRVQARARNQKALGVSHRCRDRLISIPG